MHTDCTAENFDLSLTLSRLRHFLPHQLPLKDFINHNVLEAFQELPFHDAMYKAAVNFGYKTYYPLIKFRALFEEEKISLPILQRIVQECKGAENWAIWEEKLLRKEYDGNMPARLETLRSIWTETYHINMDKEVHSFLFRFTSSYIDQGISLKQFPVHGRSMIEALRELENMSMVRFFKSKRVRYLLLDTQCNIEELLFILVGNEKYYEHYLFDQQFAHAGWSGMIAVTEKCPETLLDKKIVSLKDFIIFELLLEIDALDTKFGENKWSPLCENIPENLSLIFSPVPECEIFEVLKIWQEAFEWTYFDQVVRGLQFENVKAWEKHHYEFQAIFCIDEREGSLRRYIEKFADAQTFSTAGFFNFELYYQPENGKFYAKSCPAPLNPNFVVKEVGSRKHHHEKDSVFSKESRNLFGGWLISQTVGFWAALRMTWNIFHPAETPALVSSFTHMDKKSNLHFEYNEACSADHVYQLGFKTDEMARRAEALLKSIGLTDNFSEIVYIVGHGASSVNNPHFAAYGCGACSGQTGSVNARVAAAVLNKGEIRDILRSKGINIPKRTQFVGALHDTTQDEMEFYDDEYLSEGNKKSFQQHKKILKKALHHNAKERSRRFLLIDSHRPAAKVHHDVKLRSMSLFEPRSEWDHATNALCIVGRRDANRHLFLDRRAFLNSYNYLSDPSGEYLLGILRAVAPVCGGINLQYYFAKTDYHRLGAGSKLPHNVIGLIGIANGMDGDLRTGLPRQSVDIHDPLRLLTIVEHYPEVVLLTAKKEPATWQWFVNEWVHLAVIHPDTKQIFRLFKGEWHEYKPLTENLPVAKDFEHVLECTSENIPVHLIRAEGESDAKKW